MATNRLGKDLYNSTSDKRIISNIYKNLKKLDSREPNNSIKKWGSEPENSILRKFKWLRNS